MNAHLVGPPASPPRYATVIDALANAARSKSGLTFVDSREERRPLPFSELWDRARRMATALAELGVAPGDRVALCLPTSVDFMDAFFGALAAGAIPVPLYPPIRLGRLAEYHARTARLLQVSSAKILLTDSRVGKLLGVAALRAGVPLGFHEVSSLLARGRGHTMRPRQANDLALIQFSSGTTVEPKPVALTHANLLANIDAIDSFLPDGGPHVQRGASWLPLYHDMGLIGCLLLAVVHPGDLTLIPPELFLAKPSLWLRAISRDRATVSPAPNFAYGLCVKRVRDEDLAGCDLSSWRLALNGAEPISVEATRAFIDRFSRFGFDPRAMTPVYGLSEASLAVTFTPPGDGLRLTRLEGETAAVPRDLVSVGKPLPGVEIRIDDAQGILLAEDAIGRVRVRGPSVMRGYFSLAPGFGNFGNFDNFDNRGHPSAPRALENGWLDTGDLGFVRGGELYICGRAKELVILRGKNHAPQEFEEALEGLPGVRSGCSIAVGFMPQGGAGEELALLVERDAAVEIEEARLADQISARVVERTQVRPHVVRLLAPGTLPRTSSGKLRRGEALRQFLAEELRPPDSVTVLGVAREAAKSMAARAALRIKNALEQT